MAAEICGVKINEKRTKKEGMAAILWANGGVCRNYFHLFVQKAWNLQLGKRQPLLACSSRCVRCCEPSQVAWETRMCVGKPAGAGKKGLVPNPKHSSPVPRGDCSYL